MPKDENTSRGARITVNDVVDHILEVHTWVQRKVAELAGKMGLPAVPSRLPIYRADETPRLYSYEIHQLMEAVGVATSVECARIAREGGVAPDVVANILRVAGNPMDR